MSYHPILYKRISLDVMQWRKDGYPSQFDEIREILEYQFIDEEKLNLRFLRKPQFEALETYLYLRYVKNTKKSIELYREYFTDPNKLLESLNIHLKQTDLINILSQGGIEALFERIKTNDSFVKQYKLEAIRETLTLSYPSYIFSLVMGAGKTILIGSIIFIEFALSLITKQTIFLKNALVFAPGKTIVGSLKEISFIDIDNILPKRFATMLKNNLKITYTQDNQKNIPIIERSDYNIIITNIEKVRIQTRQAPAILSFTKKDQNKHEKEEVANRRLQQISSLKQLGIFSDEAHHTYGQALESEIKKVRKTIDYLAQTNKVNVVVNTTGTPYFKKQILKDVVFWYGLIQGIEENILKDVRENIYSYPDVRDENFIEQVLDDFFQTYKDTAIEGGYKSKIAIYFPRIEDVQTMKPHIEKKCIALGLDMNAIFSVNSKSSEKDKDIFNNRINDKNLPYRVFLLVGMGTEGWNCPSLFACCLARELTNSSNFVLQAATRCLRQIAHNTSSARIYLSSKNTSILEKQLQETYGENIHTLEQSNNRLEEKKVTLIKYDKALPPIKIKRKIKRYIIKDEEVRNIRIQKPSHKKETQSKIIVHDFPTKKTTDLSLIEKYFIDIKNENKKYISLCEAAHTLASLYALDYFDIYNQLQKTYKNKTLPPLDDLKEIQLHIEKQLDYTVEEYEKEECLTIIKKEGFFEEHTEDGSKIYTTTILVDTEKLDTLLKEKHTNIDRNNTSFHYSPYKFDSNLEVALFDWMLEQLHEKKENIQHFLFTGGICDKNKTDLVFEYKDKNDIFRNYTPDFLIIKKNGEFLFLETKGSYLVEHFKIKERYFKTYLADNCAYKLIVSDNTSIKTEDKQYIQEYLHE